MEIKHAVRTCVCVCGNKHERVVLEPDYSVDAAKALDELQVLLQLEGLDDRACMIRIYQKLAQDGVNINLQKSIMDLLRERQAAESIKRMHETLRPFSEKKQRKNKKRSSTGAS